MLIGETISFHPCYSQGTSVVRGDSQLAKEQIHYWEIKIVHWFSGTDLVCMPSIHFVYYEMREPRRIHIDFIFAKKKNTNRLNMKETIIIVY